MAGVDFAYVWDQVLRLVTNPYSNIGAALLLLGVVVIVVLIIVLTVIAAVTIRSSKPADPGELEELQYLLALLEGQELPQRASGSSPPPERRVRDYPWLAAAGSIFVASVIIGIALGATTSSSSVCLGCHTATPHTLAVRAGVRDAHRRAECVACHESSGWLGAVTIEVPGRMLHFANGLRKKPRATQYGAVASGACYRCHRTVADTTTTDEERGVRMAHKQPLAAGAECRDCHTGSTGVVSAVTVGMAPCLRCHDGKRESSACKLCHVKDVSIATVPHADPVSLKGRKLIETPDCTSCHDMKVSCDPCHGGIRMPHTELFMWWGHAREGAKDIWFNNGHGCGSCHSASRRPCTKCHAFMPGHPADEWRNSHGVAGKSTNSACSGCHDPLAYVNDRDQCGMCHNKPYVTQ